MSYQNEKERAKQNFKVKEERTKIEQAMSELVKEARFANYLLILIGMILLGIFIRMLFI